MATEKLEPVYLISGSDRPKVELSVRRLRARFDPGAVEILAALDASAADAAAACNALGLFATAGRLVLVEGVERWKADDAKAIAEYLKAPAPETVLALVGDGIRKESQLAKVCARAGSVLFWDVRRQDLTRWLQEQLGRHKAKADAAALRALIAAVGEDPALLATEVDKLATWADGDVIDLAAVEQLAAPSEPSTWALTDAWGRRDVVGVMRAAEETLERAPMPRSLVPGRIAGRMIDEVRLVLACQTFREEGVPPAEATKRLRRRHEYPVRKAYETGERFDRDELRHALIRLAELDRALKGGSRLSGELELTRALADITQPAVRSRA